MELFCVLLEICILDLGRYVIYVLLAFSKKLFHAEMIKDLLKVYHEVWTVIFGDDFVCW